MHNSRRSRTGCQACRQRKLKCDEDKPACGRCRKRGVACAPAETSIFRVHQLSNRVAAAAASVDSGTILPAEVVYSPRRGTHREVEFVQVIQPGPAYHEESVSSVGSPDFMMSDGSCPGYEEQIARQFESDLSPSLRSPTPLPPAHEQTTSGTSGQSQILITASPAQTESSRLHLETAEGLGETSIQLLYYFKEVPSKWMDLFDLTAYFTFVVPRLAATRPLLLDASCALASKHIDRILHSATGRPETASPHFRSEYWKANLHTKNWKYVSATYYDEAIRLLMKSIGNIEVTGHTESEEMLAAIAILCMYELLDPPGPEWEAHLSALPLLETTPTRILGSPTFSTARKLIKRPIFWNFVRQDSLHAFINQTHTRLNLENVDLWRETGLHISDDGLLLASCPPSDDEASGPDLNEDLASHSLFWLFGKIINYIAQSEAQRIESTPYWERLHLELRTWYSSLHATFHSFVRTPLQETPGRSAADSHASYEKISYAIPTCASAIQNYHMSCILLLAHRPSHTSTPRTSITQRMQFYRAMQKQITYHSHEIIGISLGNHPESVRVQSVQPLFVAGQCLFELEERDMVLDLLKAIEQDLGWATNYRAQELIGQWSYSLGEGLTPLGL
ncbi:hypothetical protein B0T11DRAFT_286268 [Plectosphaerella cucumerina]|uniref:Zn(2)-C6 fungal-type domain-containing protein n=1 Tax=Plectosphaerella cucumerina TaxID=40658 RepID=A0A8K0X3E2_9PEZI|nr:hypothetical protein B0T11DRAFT_286268 [Plectosphaerella cucumerina]